MIFFIIFFYFFSCRYIMNATWFDICCMSSQEFDAYAKKRFTAILLRMVYFLLKIAVHLFYYVLIFSISCKLYEGFLDSITQWLSKVSHLATHPLYSSNIL